MNCIRIQKLLSGVPFVQKNLLSNPQTWGHLDNKTLIFDKKNTHIRGSTIIFPSNVAEKYNTNKKHNKFIQTIK